MEITFGNKTFTKKDDMFAFNYFKDVLYPTLHTFSHDKVYYILSFLFTMYEMNGAIRQETNNIIITFPCVEIIFPRKNFCEALCKSTIEFE